MRYAELILQPFRHFTYVTTHSLPSRRITYVTAHSPILPLLHLRHSSFSNPSFASPASQALHLIRLASRSCPGPVWTRRNEEKSPPRRQPRSNPGCPACSQAPCRLSYLAHGQCFKTFKNIIYTNSYYRYPLCIVQCVYGRLKYPVNCCCCLLFNDSHVLQLWSDTVAVRRRIIYGLNDI